MKLPDSLYGVSDAGFRPKIPPGLLVAKEDLESLLFSFYRTVVASRKAHLRGESLVPDFADACYATATV